MLDRVTSAELVEIVAYLALEDEDTAAAQKRAEAEQASQAKQQQAGRRYF